MVENTELKTTLEEIELLKAMEALQKQKASWAAAKSDELRGSPGPRGERGEQGIPGIGKNGRDGEPGRDGVSPPAPSFIAGECIAGDSASVSLRKNEHGVFVFNFTLPRGERGATGPASTVAGPVGRRGDPGIDATPVTEAQIAAAARKFLEANVDKFRGESVVGAQGPAGERGAQDWTREDIVKVLIETLNTTGILTETMQKILKVRAILRKAAHQADARHIAEIASVVRECDKVLDYTEPVAPVTHDDVARIVGEVLAGKK
jgi:hypothetical protein